MNEISEFSKSVACNVKDDKNENYSFDVMFIIVIGSIIINVLKLLSMCNVFGRDLDSRIKNPNMMDRILLKKAIRQKLDKQYMHLVPVIQEQIVKQAQNLTSAQISLMMEEAKNAK